MPTMHELHFEYFTWMLKKIDMFRFPEYERLMSELETYQFSYRIPMDANRYEDGISLRYEFGMSVGYTQLTIANLLDVKTCSMLEMMVALAIKYDRIMENPEFESRVDQWFRVMVDTLGLKNMTNDNYDSEYVDMVIERFINRQYNPETGEGGLFPNIQKRPDYKDHDIWYQGLFYLQQYIYEDKEKE